jgi:hypothetical protein
MPGKREMAVIVKVGGICKYEGKIIHLKTLSKLPFYLLLLI